MRNLEAQISPNPQKSRRSAPTPGSSAREIARFMAEILPALRVLVVDDEPLIRWAIVQVLRSWGCTVAEATTAHAALGMVGASAPFDVILLDYWLPDSDTLAPLSALKRLSPDSEVILISAHASEDVVDQALRLGACRVLHKPFEMTQVAPAVLLAHLNQPD
jgi:CheY-like chemotaxis protein